MGVNRTLDKDFQSPRATSSSSRDGLLSRGIEAFFSEATDRCNPFRCNGDEKVTM